MDPIAILHTTCLPPLNRLAATVRERHPSFRFNVGSGSVGGATSFQGHHVYLECCRINDREPEPNCLALEVCVRDLPGTPRLCTLDVDWGAEGVRPCEGYDALREQIVFTPDAEKIIIDALPTLCTHFERCVQAWEAAYPSHS
jgi:hypothetical protein